MNNQWDFLVINNYILFDTAEKGRKTSAPQLKINIHVHHL